MKREPFCMSFEEIGRMTVPQVKWLLKQQTQYVMEKRKELRDRLENVRDGAFPVFDVTKDIDYG